MRKPRVKRQPLLLGILKIDLSKFAPLMEMYSTNEEEVISKSRLPRIVECRFLIMYFLLKNGLSFQDIATKFNKDRTSVIHADNTIRGYLDVYPKFKTQVAEIEKCLFETNSNT